MAIDANIIKIKRSGTSGAPSSLKLGELAYSYLPADGNPTNNGGDRLFIGANGVNGGTGNANDVVVIGGKYFTDLLDHTRGILTASSALIVDSNKKLDELLVDSLSLNGNTLSVVGNNNLVLQAGSTNVIELASGNYIAGGIYSGSQLILDSGISSLKQLRDGYVSLVVGTAGSATSTLTFNNDGSLTVPGTIKTLSNGDLILAPNGTGKVQINTGASSFTLPASRTTVTGYVLTANTDGSTSWAQPSSTLSLKAGTHTGDTGSDATFNLINDDIEFRGDAGAITTALSVTSGGGHSHYVVETKARFATTSLAGVATFNSNTFSVGIIGDVDVKSGGISNTQLANDSIFIGTTEVTLGDASGTTTSLGVDITGNAASVTNGVYTTDTATVTNTMLANSTISGISLGNNLADLTVGTNLNLSSAGTTYNGGTAQTINLDSALTGITSISAASGNSVTLNNGTDNLVFDATGQLVLPKFTIPNTSGTAGQVLSWVGNAASSVLAWTTVSTSLSISDGTATDTVALLTDTLTFAGSGAISTAVTNNQVAISVATATSSVKGVASFDSTDFTVTSGAVTVKEERIQDIIGAMVSSNSESNISVTYDDPNGKLDFSVATATSSALGVASFNTASFTVTAGDVTIKSAGVSNAQLANSTIYIGTTQVTLGDASGTTSSLAVNISGKASTAGTADQVANSLTFSDSGGVALNATYNGSAAKTIDYSSVGAAPKAGSSDIVTVGTLTSGSIGAGFTAIANARLANSKVTVGTTDISLGSSSTTLAGLTQVDVNNIRVTGNTISSTNTDGDIIFDPNGTGTVNVSSARITNLADPTGAQDAATKAYVDATRSGLDVKDSVRAATIGNITLTNTQTVDGVALAVGNRVLVKNQDTASENGIYVVASGAWTRATDADNSPAGEVTSGMFAFVEQGTVNADSGWVLTTDGTITLDTTSLTFVQFSGAGQITAGDGLAKTGNTLSVNVANGIEISGDNVQLASSVAGNGLTYTSGVLDVVGTTDRISVSANAIDISTNYVGQNTITTLGTIGTGTWQGNVVTYAYGGTGQSSYAKGDLLYASASNTLSKLTAGTNGQTLQLQDGLPVWADLDGGTY